MAVAYLAKRIFDGGSGVVEDGAVLVEGGRIASVGPVRSIPSGAPVVELGDATLLPGLIDAHVHLIWDSSVAPEERVSKESDALTALRAARHASHHLRAGVTTVRDTGSTGGLSVELARAIELGAVAGPRVIAAGRAITMTGGHVFYIGREADGPDDVRRAVRAELKAGAQCIKFMASGGVLGPPGEHPGAPQLTVEEMVAGVEEAHRAGRMAAAHAHSLEAINNALDADVDSIEHGSFLDQETAERMRRAGVYLVPTLSTGGALLAKAPELGISDQVRRKMVTVVEAGVEAFQVALGVGVRVAAGTDGGVPGQPHGAIAAELATMVEHGATPGQALHFATMGGAALLNVSDEVGSLEPGKSADVVAVSGDPLHDIHALRDIRLTLLGGEPMLNHAPH